MKDYLLKIFNYNHWSNEILLETIEKNNVQDEYIFKMLSHVLNAQHKRYNVMTGDTSTVVDIWEIHSLAQLKTRNNALTELYIKMISRLKLTNLNQKIETTSIYGDTFFMSITDILIHIANHSSHHRGQISLRLRELGIAPPEYSYLIYCKSFPDFW